MSTSTEPVVPVVHLKKHEMIAAARAAALAAAPPQLAARAAVTRPAHVHPRDRRAPATRNNSETPATSAQ